MSKTVLYSIVLLIGVFVSAVSQVMLKKAAQRKYASKIQEYVNPLVISAYGLFLGTTLLSLIAYKEIPLSLGPILEATSYIYISIFGVIIFKERFNKKKVFSMVLIIIGIIIYALLG